MKASKAKVSTLSNGLRIVTEEKDLNKVAIGIWIKTGSAAETKKNNGISHFLEHMAFKGTKTKTAKQLVEEIEYLGGSTNAYTSENATAYHVTLLNEHWKNGLDFLADIIQNSVFPEEELEKERNVILQELNNSLDNPTEVAGYNLFEDLYHDQPMGRKILGTAENIKKFTREDLLEYMNEQYTASNMVISLHGNINHEDVVAYCEELFGKINIGKDNEFEDNVFKYGFSKHINKKCEQAYVYLMRKGLSSKYSDEKTHYLEAVYNTILDGGMSCRLFQEVREKRGLGYCISSFSSEFYNTGTMGIAGIVEPKDVDALIEACQDVLESMKNNITEYELEKAKNTILSQIAGHNDLCFSKAQSNALSLLLRGRLTDWDEVLEFIKGVTVEDIYQFANDYTTPNYCLSITSPR